ncbi:MAG TPA: nuclear transport factor 2 family protein [Steroidobacteraceae bacterium]|jgi:ketosteroid isomerase-like protein|nr:nuclear transport factor 2 family protein [Steroidobacteraceae bacterium]
MNPTDLPFEMNRRGERASRSGGLSRFWSRAIKLSVMLLAGTTGFVSTPVQASEAQDRQTLADLDTKYQKAVEQNDAKTMAEILADDFVLVEGDGKRSTKADLVNDANSGKTHYVHQDDSERTVAVFGDTGVVTAKLRATGIEDGVRVDYLQWFTDVYIRTPNGWRYVYAQASLSLPSKSQR